MVVAGKKVLVMGMRASGISACNLLKAKGADVSCYDDFVNPLSGELVNMKGRAPEEICASVDLIVVSPSIPDTHEVLRRAFEIKLPVISELELGAAFLKVQKLAVTGTNGKTTVVCMLQKLLSNLGAVKAMGNIGYPVSQVVLDGTRLDYAVIEASSFQLEHIDTFHPKIAVIMNLAPDHMERYERFDDYINAKKRIFKNQKKDDFLLLNYDDRNMRALAEGVRPKVVWFSTKKQLSPVYIKDNYYYYGDAALCHVKESKSRGEHNRSNLLAAMNAGALLGCRKEHMTALVREYVPLPHRIEYVTTFDGKHYYNDSKGTNIHACRFAINSVEGDIGLIMGGRDKNEDYCEFFENIDERVKYVAVTGGNADKIYDSALKMGYTRINVFDSLKSAVKAVSCRPDVDSVLFSPSAASFDRYADYAERGEIFKGLVYEIKL